MPAQPTWFPRLTQIVAELRALETVPFLDRQAFERLFRVKDRRARVLMSHFEGTQIGNAWVVDRHKLIQALEAIQHGAEFQSDQRRRERIADVYERAKREHPARQVQIPITKETRSRTVSSLPSGVKLGPGELHIQFTGAEELAAKLFDLSEAMANDWPAIETALNGDP